MRKAKAQVSCATMKSKGAGQLRYHESKGADQLRYHEKQRRISAALGTMKNKGEDQLRYHDKKRHRSAALLRMVTSIFVFRCRDCIIALVSASL